MSPSISQPHYHMLVPPFQQQVPNVTLVFTTAWFCWGSSSKAFVQQNPIFHQKRLRKNARRLCQGRCLRQISRCRQKSKVSVNCFGNSSDAWTTSSLQPACEHHLLPRDFHGRQLASEEVPQPTEAQRRWCCPSAHISQSSPRMVGLCLRGATTCNSEIVSVPSNWELFFMCWRLLVLFVMLWWLAVTKRCNMGCSLTGAKSRNYLHLLRWGL